MKLRILVAVPVRPDEHPFFHTCLEKYRRAFPVENPGFSFEFAYDERDHREGRTRLAAIAAARNTILDDNLTGDHDLVLTMDSDVVALPFNLPSILYEANPDGVTAPLVLIEGTDVFYDTAGFLKDGKRCNRNRPYFDSEEWLVERDSVGTVYLAPAWLHREVRYADEPAGMTDHEELCAAARKRGLKVLCRTDTTAYHAALPLYGSQWR